MKHLKKIIILLPLIVLMGYPIWADETTFCWDSSVKSQNITSREGSGSAITTVINQSCSFGCNGARGMCNPNPYATTQMDFVVTLTLAILPIVLLYMAFNLRGIALPIQFVMLIMSLFFIISDLALFGIYFDYLNKTAIKGIINSLYLSTLFMTIFGIFFYTIYFLYNLLMKFGVLPQKKDRT